MSDEIDAGRCNELAQIDPASPCCWCPRKPSPNYCRYRAVSLVAFCYASWMTQEHRTGPTAEVERRANGRHAEGPSVTVRVCGHIGPGQSVEAGDATGAAVAAVAASMDNNPSALEPTVVQNGRVGGVVDDMQPRQEAIFTQPEFAMGQDDPRKITRTKSTQPRCSTQKRTWWPFVNVDFEAAGFILESAFLAIPAMLFCVTIPSTYLDVGALKLIRLSNKGVTSGFLLS
ncbi:hypothetical protein PV08_06596 [Exophiala spinifera]|uniref:Uncharacterized protein n=1 Tax=Exophiala spinifera TaxID=91928 RepID=A0A0D1YFF6_9EURO|nr:uncharacterized protein PV08_06596 [Exophiala spinifera]KIW13816.1 hypothetical protein PV08_06596 [Exophiala spinifera]